MPAKKPVKDYQSKSSSRDISIHKILHAARQEATGSKTNAYQATTILTGLVLALVSIVAVRLISPQNLVATLFVLSIIFALSFSPIRYAIEELVRQLFPGTDYNSHELIKRLNIISYSTLTRSELTREYFKDLRSSLDVGGVAFLFFETKTRHSLKTNQLMSHLKKLTDQEIRQLQHTCQNHNHVIKRFSDENTRNICHYYQIKLLTPLIINDRLIGILILGPKVNSKSYTTKDIKVLNAIAPKVGFAIKNSIVYESVSQKNSLLISQLKETNEKIRKANRQLKKDDKLKDEFVYIATHELKNPVTAAKGYLALIDEGHYGSVPSKLKPAIESINQSNVQLIGLLNNLLQIARTEAEKLEIKTQPVTICSLIDRVILDLNPLIDQKGLSISHICKNPSVSVMADPERLQEIFNNLITNSIKYSHQGTIKITHQIVQDKLATHVQDQGVGISKADQDKIFTRYFRVEEEAAKGIPGSGLGLFLVKQLTEKMGGQISFKSILGKGSTFTVQLPLTHTHTLKKS